MHRAAGRSESDAKSDANRGCTGTAATAAVVASTPRAPAAAPFIVRFAAPFIAAFAAQLTRRVSIPIAALFTDSILSRVDTGAGENRRRMRRQMQRKV